MDHFKPTPQNRRVFIAAMKRGELSPPEVAELCGISRATAYRWASAAKIDLAGARAGYIRRRAYSLIVGRFESKANKRRRAYQAWDDFTD